MDAALIVDEAKGPQGMLSRAAYTPAYFLAFHSIELSLKAYLLNAGLSLDELSSKKYGHRLQKLYDKAIQIGLGGDFLQDARDEQALHLLIDLNEGHQLRYLVTGFKRFPLFSIVEPFGVRLHQSISKTVDRLDVYVGSDDWQSNPTNVQRLFQNTSAEVTVVANAGHSLPKEFVGQVLDRLIA